jgi:hypothetical protein
VDPRHRRRGARRARPAEGRVLSGARARRHAASDHFADDHERRRRERCLAYGIRDRREIGDDHALLGERRARHDGDGRRWGTSLFHETLRRVCERREAHVEDDRPFPRDPIAEIVVSAVVPRLRRDERDRRRDFAMRQGDPRARRGAERGAHARDDLERDTERVELLRLLAAAPEDERIASLEAHDVDSLEGAIEHDRVNRRSVRTRPFAPPDGDPLGALGCEREDLGPDELVVGDDARRRQKAVGSDRQELRIPRARADEEDLAARLTEDGAIEQTI